MSTALNGVPGRAVPGAFVPGRPLLILAPAPPANMRIIPAGPLAAIVNITQP